MDLEDTIPLAELKSRDERPPAREDEENIPLSEIQSRLREKANQKKTLLGSLPDEELNEKPCFLCDQLLEESFTRLMDDRESRIGVLDTC